MKTRENRYGEREWRLADYSRERLLGYADSFRELARSMDGKELLEDADGEGFLEGEDRAELLAGKSQRESRRVLCRSLDEMARLMTRVASEIFQGRPVEEKNKRLLTYALKTEGICVTDVFYMSQPDGREGLGLTMYTRRPEGIYSADVAGMLSVLLNRRMECSVASPGRVDGASRSFLFMDEARYTVMTGVARAVREGEECSGDSFSVLQSDGGRVTALLSDGMGSGQRALRDSERVLDLMEKLLEAGYEAEGAVNLVNSSLIAASSEGNMSTLDICELNLYDGSCQFQKAGAASSFIKGENGVEEICARNLPLGILTTVDKTAVGRQLQDGDYVILMTDGVTDAFMRQEDEEALKKLIVRLKERNPQELAEKLLTLALCAGGGQIADDMTILVLGIWENA